MPGLLEWAIHGPIDTIVGLRVVGIIIAACWVSVLGRYLYLKMKSLSGFAAPILSIIVGWMIFALFSIGVFPVFLVINRNEQLIIPSVIALIFIFRSVPTDTNRKSSVLLIILGALYFFAVSLILAAHPKGLFLIPLFLLVGCRLAFATKCKTVWVLGLGLLVFHIGETYAMYSHAFSCKELPAFENQLRSYSFSPFSIFYDPLDFIRRSYHSVAEFPKYLKQLGFSKQTDASYLPPLELSKWARLSNTFISLNLALIFLATPIALTYRCFQSSTLMLRPLSVNLLLLTLEGCLLLSALFNLPKNWYDAGYIYALQLIILIFFVGENFPDFLTSRIVKALTLYLVTTAILSQFVFIGRNLPEFRKGYAGPGTTIAGKNFRQIDTDISAAASLCLIKVNSSSRLVVDDYTYLSLRKSKRPMAITYIWQLPNDVVRRQFLRDSGSDGLITMCTGLLDPYQSRLKKSGSVCCISKADLSQLPD